MGSRKTSFFCMRENAGGGTLWLASRVLVLPAASCLRINRVLTAAQSHKVMHVRRNVLALAAIVLFVASSSVRADVWPRFRGANGDGQAAAPAVPSEFTEADYAWKSALPGVGHSSPVVWNDRVFVTSADADTAELHLMCFDLKSGQEQWQRRYPGGSHAKHLTNSFATATPAVDAEHVYVAWKTGNTVRLAAVTHEGDDVWQEEVGHLAEAHGFGTSPMLAGDVVCITNDTDNDVDSQIVGFNRKTGDRLWQTPCGIGKTSYATPLLWEAPGGRRLVLMSTMSRGLTAYEPTTGEIVWNAFTTDLPDRCVSSPILAGDTVLISCGSGNNGKHLIGAKLGGATDVPQEAYRLTGSIPNIPTPVVAGDLVFLWYDRGIVTCIDSATGKVHWRERVGGNFHSSPLRVGDRLFGISLEGEVVVLAASQDYKLLGRSDLSESVTATPAVADGRMLIRTEQSLICLGAKP
jgi:outer membrane protein assembly factor BamB